MCECRLLIDSKTDKPIEIADVPHSFIYERYGKEFKLLEGIKMSGIIDYASASEINNAYGMKHGYMFIIGEKQ